MQSFFHKMKQFVFGRVMLDLSQKYTYVNTESLSRSIPP